MAPDEAGFIFYSSSATDHGSITVAARSRASTVFVRSNVGILGSNPTQGMDVSLSLFCLCCPV